MIRVLTLLLVLLSSFSAMSFRFVCNGLQANGEERSDDCGACDVEHAARWSSPQIPIIVGHETLPATITHDEWRTIVDQSLAAWENIDGTSLKFTQLDGSNLREFGANESAHEIFWITDRDEWRKLVGSGEFGTLGATLPRYTCESGGNSGRTIFDADLVLNGLPHINWAFDCKDDDCISVQTTLVHELGHFFGLDHPCLMCSSSIMSARAGFDLINPVFDDMEGLRALYPAQENTGGFGFPCSNDSDCSSENHCISDGANNYCSKQCQSENDCVQGGICREINGGKTCTFVDAASAGGRTVGDNCMRGPCAEPLICAGANEPNYFCFQPCRNNLDCRPKEQCVNLEENLSLCVGIKSKNDACTHRELCEEQLYCVFETDDDGFCRAPCEPTDTAGTGCAAEEKCELLENRVEICMPLTKSLALDDNSDGFGHRDGVKMPTVNTPDPIKGDEVQGCSQQKHGGTWWPMLALLTLFMSRRLRKKAAIARD